MSGPLRLGVNIDHVATLRNARGGAHPDPLRAARIALEAGADGITAHLREDRRHIRDADIGRLRQEIPLPLNLEMAATAEMIALALKVKPHAVCLVPEKREERTTEGGLEVVRNRSLLRECSAKLKDEGIRVSFFINPSLTQVEAAKSAGAQIVELHTGRYCDAEAQARVEELNYIRQATEYAETLGLECHAGHGLSFDTVSAVASIAYISELNIGHFLIGEAVFTGLGESIRRMKQLMQEARA
jgi:pyridoxine 5-phosphate synthase